MNIVLTGSVAVGKSTIMRKLKEEIETLFIFPEFIDENLILSTEEEKRKSLELLKKRFNGEIEPYELQDYILQRWDDYADRGERIDKNRPRLFERLPDDSVEIFALPIVSSEEYTQLKLHLVRTNRKLPSYNSMNGKKTLWINYENDFNPSKEDKIIKLIKKAQSSNIENIIINIYSTGVRNYENYIKRGRTEERYTLESMKSINDRYSAYMAKIISEIKPYKIVNI